MKLIFASVLVVVGSTAVVNAEVWRGIVPLHSNRSNVERLLGPPSGECKCLYEAGSENVRVDYAKAPCVGYPSGWNVSSDMVLTIRVRSAEPKRFSDLHLVMTDFHKAVDDTFTTYYSNREEGIEYSVSSEGIVQSVSYLPSGNDSQLRCSCFPLVDESIQRSTSFDGFGLRSMSDVLARLDNYIIALLNNQRWKGYVLLYRGRQTSQRQLSTYRNSIMQHILRKRAVPPDRIRLIDAGYREGPEIELFLLPAGLSPPEPRPSWSPCKNSDRAAEQFNKRRI